MSILLFVSCLGGLSLQELHQHLFAIRLLHFSHLAQAEMSWKNQGSNRLVPVTHLQITQGIQGTNGSKDQAQIDY